MLIINSATISVAALSEITVTVAMAYGELFFVEGYRLLDQEPQDLGLLRII